MKPGKGHYRKSTPTSTTTLHNLIGIAQVIDRYLELVSREVSFERLSQSVSNLRYVLLEMDFGPPDGFREASSPRKMA